MTTKYSSHSELFGKIIRSQNDCHTLYAIKFQGPKAINLSVNPGCETSSTLLPNYSFEHATYRAVMLYESFVNKSGVRDWLDTAPELLF